MYMTPVSSRESSQQKLGRGRVSAPPLSLRPPFLRGPPRNRNGPTSDRSSSFPATFGMAPRTACPEARPRTPTDRDKAVPKSSCADMTEFPAHSGRPPWRCVRRAYQGCAAAASHTARIPDVARRSSSSVQQQGFFFFSFSCFLVGGFFLVLLRQSMPVRAPLRIALERPEVGPSAILPNAMRCRRRADDAPTGGCRPPPPQSSTAGSRRR